MRDRFSDFMKGLDYDLEVPAEGVYTYDDSPREGVLVIKSEDRRVTLTYVSFKKAPRSVGRFFGKDPVSLNKIYAGKKSYQDEDSGIDAVRRILMLLASCPFGVGNRNNRLE